MKKHIRFKATALALALVFPIFFSLLNVNGSNSNVANAAVNGFVTRSGSQLMLNGQPFRFAGPNIHWLGLDDNPTVDWPSQYRVTDALLTAKEMGATVVRSHTLGFSTGCAKCIMPSLGVYNEEALKRVDFAIKTAGDIGLRLILPLTDNYRYYHGGKYNFVEWRGLTNEDDFYYNRTVVQDFKNYISTIMNRVNTYTGVAYKNDPTIMAWETGNEVISPAEWTGEIASHIKSISANQLTIDGKYWLNRGTLPMPQVDIHNDHLYPMEIDRMVTDANDTKAANKVIIIGEFDWMNNRGGPALSDFLSAVENNAVAGNLYWTLISHKDIYGYAQHGDGYSLHYPGDNADMRYRAQLLRTHAYKMSGRAATHGIPNPPQIMQIDTTGIITWQGAAGADKYSIERSTSSANGPWTTICDRCVDDNSGPWKDSTRPVGNTWYRMKSHNLDGLAGAYTPVYALRSNIAATTANNTVMVDNMTDLTKVLSSLNLSLEATNASFFESEPLRLRRNSSNAQESVWRWNGAVSFEAVTYFWPGEAISHFSFFTSQDGINWSPANPTISTGWGDWQRVVYTLNNMSGVNFVKMRWGNVGGQFWNPQIGKVSMAASAGGIVVAPPTATPTPTTAAPTATPPATPTATPPPSTGGQTLSDSLNDWSKSYSHTGNLSFDGTNPAYFGGDSSRARRNTATNEEITWKLDGVKTVDMNAYYWPSETVSQFSFYVSNDNANWQEVTPVISGGNGDWKAYNYKLNISQNANFVKVRWNNTTGQFWTPQISNITLTAGAVQTLNDNLNDWSKSYSHTSNLTFEVTNASYFNNDTSRVRRTTATNEEIVWKLNGVKSATMAAYYWPSETVSQFSFYVSADASNWQQVTPVIGGGTGDWLGYTYKLSIAQNTNFVKVRWNNTTGQFWTPQISGILLSTAN